MCANRVFRLCFFTFSTWHRVMARLTLSNCKGHNRIKFFPRGGPSCTEFQCDSFRGQR